MSKIPSFNVARVVADTDEKDMKVIAEVMDNLDQTDLLAELDKMDRDGLVGLVRYCDAFITGTFLKDMLEKAVAQNGRNSQGFHRQDIPDLPIGMYI